jgi:hypothetical protein
MTAPEEGAKEQRAVADIKALDQRLSGATYAQIQQVNGYRTRYQAKDAVKRALKKHHIEPIQERIVIVLARYERMLLALWRGVTAGDVPSIREARAITDSITKLEGLAAPEKHELAMTWPAIEADTREKARAAGLGADDEEAAVEFVRTHLAL